MRSLEPPGRTSYVELELAAVRLCATSCHWSGARCLHEACAFVVKFVFATKVQRLLGMEAKGRNNLSPDVASVVQ